MSTLRISDAPLLPDVNGTEKIPTGGRGDYAVSIAQIKEYTRGELLQQVEDHINDTSNPHQVTKDQVGLGNVDNTSDLNKPISTLTQEALDLKADKSTTYTKTEVDTSLGLKADKSTTYTKTEVDTSLGLKADKSTTYTKTEVDTSLGLKADKSDTYNKTEVDNSLTAIAGGHKAYQTLALAQADQASLPENTIVEVTNDPTASNNGTYQWNGTTLTKSAYDPLTQAKDYTDTAKSEAISAAAADATTKADLAEANAKSYTDLKVVDLYINESINLFDKDSVTVGFRPTYTADGLTAAAGQNTSDFIAIQPRYQYVRNTTGGIWISFYDASKVFISGTYITTATSINTPANAAFMRLSVPDAQLNSAMITRGELSGGDYVPYESEKVAMSALSSFYVGNNFNTIKTNNLLDFSELEFTSYSTSDGTQTGSTLAPWILLPTKPAYFYSSNFSNSAFIFYDADMQFITALNSVQNAKAPPLAAFVRVRIGSSQTVSSVRNAVVLEASHIADTFIPNETQQPTATSTYGFYKSQWYQKTWFVMGDSISTGNGIASTYASKPYHYLIAGDKRCKVHNIAVSGRTIAVASNADNLNQQVTNGKMPDTANAPDLITIFAGTNDFGYNITIGTISDTDPATFYGGLNKLFTDIQARFPYAKVGVITPLLRADRSLTNALGATLSDYVNAIKLAAKKYEVPVLDFYNNGCGINFNSDAMTQIYTVNNDKIHPNDAGHRILAPKIAAFIESL